MESRNNYITCELLMKGGVCGSPSDETPSGALEIGFGVRYCKEIFSRTDLSCLVECDGFEIKEDKRKATDTSDPVD